MWKLIPKVTLVIVALVSGLVYANGNDGFEQDKAHRMLRRRGRRRGGGGFFSTLSRLGNAAGSAANGISNAVDSIGSFFGGGDDDDDRELILTEADVRQEFAAMTEDDRELVFGALARLAPTIARGAVRYGPDIAQGISSLFGGDMTEDDRELILSETEVQKLSQDMNHNYKGMTVDDRALFFSALARLAPRIARAAARYGPDIADAASNLLGGGSNDEDERELPLFSSLAAMAAPHAIDAAVRHGPGIARGIGRGFSRLFGGDMTEDDRELTSSDILTLKDYVEELSQSYDDMTKDDRALFFGALARLAPRIARAAVRYGPGIADAASNLLGGGSNDEDDRELILFKEELTEDQLQELIQQVDNMSKDDRELFFRRFGSALSSAARSVGRGVTTVARHAANIVRAIPGAVKTGMNYARQGGDIYNNARKSISDAIDSVHPGLSDTFDSYVPEIPSEEELNALMDQVDELNDNYEAMTRDDRELVLGGLLTKTLPLLANEDERELILSNGELNEDQLQKLIQQVADMSKDDRELFFRRFGSALSSAARSVGNAASSAARTVGNAASSVAGALPGIARTAANVGAAIPGAIETGMNYARQGVDTYNNARNSISGAIDSVNPGLSDTFDSYVPDIPSEEELNALMDQVDELNDNYEAMTRDDRELVLGGLLTKTLPLLANEDERELILSNGELNEDQLQKLIQQVADMSKDDRELFFSRLGSALSSAARSVGNAASSAARTVGNAASSVAGALPGIARTAANVGAAIPGAIETGMNYARQGVDTYNNARNSISGAIDSVNPGLSDTFDSYVPDIPSDATDSVEAF